MRPAPAARHPWWLYACTLAACGVYLALAFAVSSRTSATSDEVPHIGAGVRYLQGDLRLNLEHPPLIKVLASLALPERRPPLPLAAGPLARKVQWSYGSEWLHGAEQAPLELLQRARAPLIVLNACLVLLVAAVTHELAGALGACIAAWLVALCPLWLAHGMLVTTDATASVWCFASVALCTRLAKRDGLSRESLRAAPAPAQIAPEREREREPPGGSPAHAQISECEPLRAAPAPAQIAPERERERERERHGGSPAHAQISERAREPPEASSARSGALWNLQLTAALATTVALAAMTKYSMLALGPLLVCGMAVDALRARRADRVLRVAVASALGAAIAVCFAWGLPPNPALYLEGVRRVGTDHNAAHLCYAFGALFPGHDRLYFARALMVKLPWPTWVLAAYAAFAAYVDRRRQQQESSVFPAAAGSVALGYYVLMAQYAPAIGVRYVLPIAPFLCVAAGIGAARLARQRAGRWVLSGLMLCQLYSQVTAVRASPLAFFNGLFCSTGDSLPCLDDSNVDWGQALPDLASYRDRDYPGVLVRVIYQGSSPVSAYVPNAVEADLEELATPRRALYAISLHYRVRLPEGSWPRQFEPHAIVAGAYAVFDLRSDTRGAP